MSGYRNLVTEFTSVANPRHRLTAVIAVDGDVHLATQNLEENSSYQNAQIRLRTYAGGGVNILLQNIMAGLVSKNQDNSFQSDFLSELYKSSIPNDFQEFSFRCDDNPGSHLKIAISEDLFGIQTNCHDEEKDRASGGFMSRRGDGAMVWIHKDMLPKVYADLKAYLTEGKEVDASLYGNRAFAFLQRECV